MPAKIIAWATIGWFTTLALAGPILIWKRLGPWRAVGRYAKW